MQKNYKRLVFTDHALDRLASRAITQEMVYQVVTSPKVEYPNGQSTKFIKTIDHRQLHVIADHLKAEKKWLVISVWVRGEEDKAPVVWKIITFPFWLVWQGVKKSWRLFFHS